MPNTYKPVSAWARHHFGDDDFDHEFSVGDEHDHIGNGHLQLVPRPYRVLADNYEAGKQGEEFMGTFPIETEAALVSGGIIERVEAKPAKKAAAKKTTDKS